MFSILWFRKFAHNSMLGASAIKCLQISILATGSASQRSSFLLPFSASGRQVAGRKGYAFCLFCGFRATI